MSSNIRFIIGCFGPRVPWTWSPMWSPHLASLQEIGLHSELRKKDFLMGKSESGFYMFNEGPLLPHDLHFVHIAKAFITLNRQDGYKHMSPFSHMPSVRIHLLFFINLSYTTGGLFPPDPRMSFRLPMKSSPLRLKGPPYLMECKCHIFLHVWTRISSLKKFKNVHHPGLPMKNKPTGSLHMIFHDLKTPSWGHGALSRSSNFDRVSKQRAHIFIKS